MKFLNVLLLLTFLVFHASCQNKEGLKSSKWSSPISLENQFSDKVVGMQNADLLSTLLADDFISYHFPQPGKNNKEVFTKGMKSLFEGFPDIKVKRVEQHEMGDKVYTYAYWEGTHTGSFMGIPATNKKVHVEYMDIWKIKNGKISENWVVMDIMGLMIQLGVVNK